MSMTSAATPSLNGDERVVLEPCLLAMPLDAARNTALTKCALTAFSGILVLVAGVGGLAYWLTSDWYHDPGPYPDGWAGFTPETFWGLVLFNCLTTLGYVLLYIGVTTGARITSHGSGAAAEATWLGMQGAMGMSSVVVGMYGAIVWGGDSFMNCLGMFCVGTNRYHEVKIPHTIRDSAGEGWLGVVGMWVFFCLVPIGLVMLWRCARRMALPAYGEQDQHVNAAAFDTKTVASEKAWGKRWLFVALLVSLVVIVWMAVLSFFIPDDWEYFTDQRFATAARLEVVDPSISNVTEKYAICSEYYVTITCPELPWAFFVSHQIQVSDELYLKLFPGNLFFYCYLVGILLAAFIATHVNPKWAAFWAKPMPPMPAFLPAILRPRFTRGEFAAMWVTKWLFVVSFIYWVHDHNFDGNYSPSNTGDTIGNTNSARWARSTGQIAVLALSLLMFAGSRQSVMHKLLGTSWESFIWAHKVLGYTMLIALVAHIGFWWKQYANEKIFPAEIFQLPPQNPEGIDNFTVPLIFITTMILFLAMGFLALPIVRRRAFEVFYYSHLFAAWTTLPVTLWHAASGWEYMLPGLTVWLIDRVLRASRSGARVRILSAKTTAQADNDQVNRNAEPARSLELKFVVDAGGLQGARAGQYVFVNVPELSIFEWHPFTLSHCAGVEAGRENSGNYLSLHIKSMGAGTWTDRLFQHVVTHVTPEGLMPEGSMTLAVDGPCGAPFDWSGHTDVILVGGGIGVTPVACIYDSLKRQRVMRTLDTADAAMIGVRKLRAVWALREEPLLWTDLRLQLSGLKADADNDDTNLIGSEAAFPDHNASIHLTRACAPQLIKAYKEPAAYHPGERPPTLTCGRPDVPTILEEELCDMSMDEKPLLPGRNPIVFVCGPEPLVQATMDWCDARGVAVHRETFLL